MIPTSNSGRVAGSSSSATGPCSRPTSRRTPELRGRSGRRSTGSIGRATDPSPFLLWLDLFSPHGPWDPPQPYRDQYAAAEPDEFEAGEEGDLVEEEGRRDRPRRGPRPDRRPRRRGRRRARRGGAAPAPADLRGDRHAGRSLARRALRRPRSHGTARRHARSSSPAIRASPSASTATSAGSAPGSTRS